MSRSFDFVVVVVVWTVAILIHRIGISLFQPGSPLYGIATSGTEVLNGPERAELWSQILVIYMPVLVGGGVIAWAFIREYQRQALTAAPGRRP